MELDEALMEELLAKLDWKSGIRPLGGIATESCFVQKQMPIIKRQLVETQSTSILVTQSSWTHQLIDSGVISDLNDDTTMHSLSELHLLFHTRQQQPAHRTFHRLQFDAQAYFSVNQILRPTIKFQRVLESALSHLPHDPNRAWQELCKVWHDFGFLWPQKIILGYRHHIKHSYQVQNDEERLYQLQSANEITATSMDTKLQKNSRSKGLSSSSNQSNNRKDINNKFSININEDDHTLRQSVLSWQVIKRTDVRPIYEFLPTEMRDVIYQLIKQFVHRIPLNQPFLLRNISTGGYLCWRYNLRQQVQQHMQQQQVNENTTMSKQDNHHHKPYLFATLPITDANINLFTWKFIDTLPNTSIKTYQRNQHHHQIEKYVRCGSQLYLSSFYTQDDNNNNNNNNNNSALPSSPPSSLPQQILTSNLSDGIKSRHWNPILEKTTRVRSLEFTNLSSSSLQQQQPQQHCWVIESPDLGLDRDDDISTDGHLNVDIAIGRLKPILHKEIISLRQILYLCSVKNQLSRSSSTQGNHHQRPGTTNDTNHQATKESESPFTAIPSPVPPAAAAVMAMVQHDLFEDTLSDQFSKTNNNSNNHRHTSVNVDQQQNHHHHHHHHHHLDESNIISSNSTLPLTSTTANTSQTSLPFYNLQTYTVLSNPSKVFSPMISSSHSTSPLLSTQQHHQYHQLNPVLAKEHALISELEESYWMIELYSQLEKDHQHDQQQQQHFMIHSQKQYQQQQKNKGKQKLQINNYHNNKLNNESLIKQPQLKMVMSLDTLREGVNTKQTDHPFHHNADDHGSLRRVQSFSSVYDHKYHHQNHQQQEESNHQRFSGILVEKKNEIKKYNEQQQQNNPITFLKQDKFMIKDGILQEKANNNVQPYLRLYASKQHNKTWSHFIKQSTLTNIKRWLKSQ